MARPNFSEDVRREVLEENNYMCQYCKVERIVDFHHRIINSKSNRARWGKLVQSKVNCVGLCRGCHSSGKIRNFYKMKDFA